MSRSSGTVQILSVAVNGSHDWVFGVGAEFVGEARNMVLRASATGAGTVGGIVSCYRGSVVGGVLVYDDTPATVFTLAGNLLSVASQAFEPTGDINWRFVVSGIAAATTIALACGWWQE